MTQKFRNKQTCTGDNISWMTPTSARKSIMQLDLTSDTVCHVTLTVISNTINTSTPMTEIRILAIQ